MAEQYVRRRWPSAGPERSTRLTDDVNVVRALPSPTVSVRPLRPNELADASAALAASIGPSSARPEAVARVLTRHPESVWLFDERGQIVGGAALLYLLPKGMQQLIAGTINVSAPDQSLLCASGQRPAGIYLWTLFGRARAGIGLSCLMEDLRCQRLRNIDLWATSRSAEPRVLRGLGFNSAFAETADLFRHPLGEPQAS